MSGVVNQSGFYPPTVKPSARALPLYISILRFVRNPLRALPRAVYSEPKVTYGRKRPLVAWVTDPELLEKIFVKETSVFAKTRLDKRVLKALIGEGLLVADGDLWRWQRKLAAPLFRPSDVLGYVPTMVACAEEQVARWLSAGTPHTAEIEVDMTETTFDVITKTILAGVEPEEIATIKRAGHAYIRPIMWSVAAGLLLWPERYWYPGKRSMVRAAAESRAAVQAFIDRRRAQGLDGDDLVARMLKARHPDSGAAMTDAQLIDNLMTFLLAGHETTAKALTWTLYLLARAPEWQERARQEALAVAGDRPITGDDIAKLTVTQRILKEAMRVYPPVPALTRVNTVATELGGIKFPEPTLIVVPVYAVHRHAARWEDPDRFDPDRFLPEREATYHRMQFVPFGVGPRVCIGATFAMAEATAILATFLRRARFDWDGRHAPEPISRITLHPNGGMPLRVTLV